MSSLVFNISKDWDSTTSLSNLFHCLITFTPQKFFLMLKLNFLHLSFCPLALVLSESTTEKTLVLSLLPPWDIYTHWYISLRLFFSRLSCSSSLSLSPYVRCSHPFIIFVVLQWTCSTVSLSLLYWVPNTAPSTPDVFHQSWAEGKQGPSGHASPSAPQDAVGLFLPRRHIAGSWSTPHPPGLRRTFMSNCFPTCWPLAHPSVWNYISSRVKRKYRNLT